MFQRVAAEAEKVGPPKWIWREQGTTRMAVEEKVIAPAETCCKDTECRRKRLGFAQFNGS